MPDGHMASNQKIISRALTPHKVLNTEAGFIKIMQQLPGKSFVHKADYRFIFTCLVLMATTRSLIHLGSEYANDDLAAGHMINSVIFIGCYLLTLTVSHSARHISAKPAWMAPCQIW